MTETEIRVEADVFMALPRAERRAKYHKLDREVKLRVRKLSESRRGIAFRTEGGQPVLTKGASIAQIVQQATKLAEMPKRMAVLTESITNLKANLQENWGEEALEEAEEALKTINQ